MSVVAFTAPCPLWRAAPRGTPISAPRRVPSLSRRPRAAARQPRAAPPQTTATGSDDHPARVALPPAFDAVMHQFALSLAGVYAGLAGVSPAAAVPEALVEAFKSKPASLAHPALMWVLLGTSLYTFYLGYKASLVRKVDKDARKELVQGKFGDRHFRTSSLLFTTMTIATFSGMANTYTRTGKLFPGPHLYAGLGLVATMAVMSAFVPYMQKGKDWARNSHFTIAFLAVGLFGWQAKSGMVIVGKLLGWDK